MAILCVAARRFKVGDGESALAYTNANKLGDSDERPLLSRHGNRVLLG